MPRSGIAGSYAGFIPSFLRNLHTVSIGAVSIDIPSNSEGGCPFLHTLSSTCVVDFFIMAILSSVRWHLIVIWFAFSLIMSDAKHLFMFLLALRMSSLEKYLFRAFAHFLIQLFVFLALSCMSYLYILEINPLSVVSAVLFSPILRAVFSPWL